MTDSLNKISYNIPTKWYPRPDGMCFDALGPEMPGVSDVVSSMNACVRVLEPLESWVEDNHTLVITEPQRAFLNRLDGIREAFARYTEDLMEYEFREALMGLDVYETVRFSEMLMEALVLCARVRRFVETFSLGRYAVWLFEEFGELREASESVVAAEEAARSELFFYRGRDRVRHTQVYRLMKDGQREKSRKK